MACVVPVCSPQHRTPTADDRPLYSQAEQHGSVGGTPPYSVYLKSAIEYIQDYQNGSPCLIGEYLKSAIEYIQDYQNGLVEGGGGGECFLGISKIYNKIHTSIFPS